MAARPRGWERLKGRYIGALLQGDAPAAQRLVGEALAQRWNPLRLYLEVLAPAQVVVGEEWHAGRINVAQEHLATQITLDQMDRVRRAVRARPPVGLQAVAAAVQGEQHMLGPRMVADFLLLDGWQVDFLGADTPTPDLVEFVARRRPDLAVLGVTLADNLAALREAAGDLKRLDRAPRILAGGAALAGHVAQALEWGVDVTGGDALEGLQEVRRLFELAGSTSSLEDVLQTLGHRVRWLRKQHGWNQEQLARAAGLDRTYISAVEKGRQNLTLAAVIRLSQALDADLQQLLIGTPVVEHGAPRR